MGGIAVTPRLRREYSVGSRLAQVEKMTNRIKQYHKNTTAVSGSYEEKLVAINGNKKPTDVFPEVCSAIDSALAK